MAFKNQYIKQFGVLVNNATTGHKLQGMSKDNIIIVDWFYSVKNWVYVVLSRVRTLSGLHLFKELKIEKYFKEDNKLKKHMRELENLERKTLASVREIPKTPTLLESEHKSTSKSTTGFKVEMLISDKNNKKIKQKAQQSSQIPKNKYKKKKRKTTKAIRRNRSNIKPPQYKYDSYLFTKTIKCSMPRCLGFWQSYSFLALTFSYHNTNEWKYM